jgi:hypothetical protein
MQICDVIVNLHKTSDHKMVEKIFMDVNILQQW